MQFYFIKKNVCFHKIWLYLKVKSLYWPSFFYKFAENRDFFISRFLPWPSAFCTLKLEGKGQRCFLHSQLGSHQRVSPIGYCHKAPPTFFYLYLHRATSPATPRQFYLSQNCTSNTCWVIFILFTPCVNFTQTFAHSILLGYFLHLVKSINILGNFFTHLQLRILLSGQFYPDLCLRPILYRVIFYILCDL